MGSPHLYDRLATRKRALAQGAPNGRLGSFPDIHEGLLSASSGRSDVLKTYLASRTTVCASTCTNRAHHRSRCQDNVNLHPLAR